MPCRGSTTMPSTRRSSPQTFSTSSASCLPSTQIRLALATWARWPATRTEPDAVRAASGRRLACRGGRRHQPDRLALQEEPEAKPEGPRLAPPVLKRHHMHPAGLLHPRHRADPAGLDILQHHAALHRHFGQVRSWRARRCPAGPSSGTTFVTHCFALGRCRPAALSAAGPSRAGVSPGAVPMLTTRRLILDWLALRHVEC